MRGRYIQGQPTVFGMVLPARGRWRHHQTERRLHAAWQEAARLARTPIIYTATDENCPLPTRGVMASPELPSANDVAEALKHLNALRTDHWTAIERIERLLAAGVDVLVGAQPVARMVALDDGLGTVILEFIGERPPAGTVLYAAGVIASDGTKP